MKKNERSSEKCQIHIAFFVAIWNDFKKLFEEIKLRKIVDAYAIFRKMQRYVYAGERQRDRDATETETEMLQRLRDREIEIEIETDGDKETREKGNRNRNREETEKHSNSRQRQRQRAHVCFQRGFLFHACSPSQHSLVNQLHLREVLPRTERERDDDDDDKRKREMRTRRD